MKKIVSNKNIKTNIYRIQANDSIMSEYFVEITAPNRALHYESLPKLPPVKPYSIIRLINFKVSISYIIL